MAAGTSSPELFTALVAVWAPKDDIGDATIVGSGTHCTIPPYCPACRIPE